MVKIINLDGVGDDGITGDNITPIVQEPEEYSINLYDVPMETLAGLPDVDTTGVENDSLLLYNAVSEKWQPSRYLANHTFEAGHY